MKATRVLLFLPLILMAACMSSKTENFNPDFEVIGHRGHVSTFPENTIEGFLSAVTLGVEAIELDLAVSADHKVVVSHEPYMKANSMLTPDGKRINSRKEKNYRLFEMTYDSIRRFKSGHLPNPKFRSQRRLDAYKPLLEEVLDTVEAYTKGRELEPVKYYLEIKSDPADYDIFQPHPDKFVELVMQIVEERKLEDRVILMSFDTELLKEVHQQFPHIKISYLLYTKGIDEGLKQLGFTPDLLSPYYKQLKKYETVVALQEQGIKVVPWTVNRKRDILRMIHNGVDGIISDHPERVLRERSRLKE